MFIEVLSEAVLSAIVERGLVALERTSLKDSSHHRPKEARERAAAALRSHLAMLSRWSSEIAFRDLLRAKALSTSFVELDLEFTEPGIDSPAEGRERKVSDLRELP